MNPRTFAIKLQARGISVLRVEPADFIDTEDHAIHLTETVHLQVGSLDSTVSVVREEGEEFRFWPVRQAHRLDHIQADIQEALAEGA